MRRTAALLLVSIFGWAAQAQDGPTNQIHYPLAPSELVGALEGADAARLAGKHEQAIRLYRSVLDADAPAVGVGGYQIAPVEEKRARAGARAPRRFKGVTQWAMEGLRKLPAEGKALFRENYDYRARSAMTQALKEPGAYRALARAYELYPISTHAPLILEAMAEAALEQGHLGRAYRCLQTLLRHHERELPDPQRVRQKMLVCAVGLGRTADVRELANAIRNHDPDGTIHLDQAPVAVEALVARSLEVEAYRKGAAKGQRPNVRSARLSASNQAATPTPLTLGRERFRPFNFQRPAQRGGGNRFVPNVRGGMPARHMPLVEGDTCFVITADSLTAYDLRTGESKSRIPPLGPRHADDNDKVQFSGATDMGILAAPFVDHVLLDQNYRGIPIKVKIPLRKLAGFDTDRWRWAWMHARALDDTPMESWSFPTPPAADEGLIYASAFSIEGFVNCYVAAFDSRTGEPVWGTWLASGQVEQTMFGEQATEPLCVPVAVHDGLVFHATSFGCVAAVDVDTGRVVWVTEYDQIEVKAPRGYYADPRNIVWENNAPLVEGDSLIVAPMDSDYYYSYDVKTGARRWRELRRRSSVNADLRYVLGASQGRVALGGGHEVHCRDVVSGKLVWRARLGGRTVSGRGVIAGDQVCVPVNGELFMVDLDTGKPTRAPVSVTGNLVVVGDHVVFAGSDGRLAVYRNDAVKTSPERREEDF
jgi:outer membrane protein assembly factor BamB/tetratricopeptide (TPR) repeat protein